jgi:hypothetical protein
MKTIINLYITFFLALSISFCASPQNEIIEWRDSIPSNIEIEELKKLEHPSSFIIDWKNPEKLDDNRTRYHLTTNTNDILNMDYFIEFENDVYVGLFPHK